MNNNDEPSHDVIADAMWEALDRDQGMPHSGVDALYVAAEFVKLLNEARYEVVHVPEGAHVSVRWSREALIEKLNREEGDT